MAWTYSDYITTDDLTEKRRLLRLHVKEVADAIKDPQSHNIDGEGYTSTDYRGYLATLKAELRELNSKIGNGESPFMPVRLGR